MAYATWEDYVAFLGGDAALGHVTEEEFPAFAGRATDAIDAATRHKIPLFYDDLDGLTSSQRARVVRACCMQIEYYGLTGLDGALAGGGGGYTVGKVSMAAATGGARPGALSPAARDALSTTGLLYAGVRVCGE